MESMSERLNTLILLYRCICIYFRMLEAKLDQKLQCSKLTCR